MSDQFKRNEIARADFSVRTTQNLAAARKLAPRTQQSQSSQIAVSNAQDALRDAQNGSQR